EVTVSQVINALDWGITDTNADDFWAAFGLQGDGIVVASIDTGVQWNHPALDQSFKCGTNPSDPACWADPSNICGGSACDNNGHGTHTMGTMVGDDDPSLTYQVGMAPNAQWIACKGCESSSCSDTALNACADWILAPDGDPANRPNIVNNSWGGGGGDTWYQAKVVAWRAAGIFPAFSAGNSGSACGSLGSPGDYQESFGTASHTSSRTISDFSSRGASVFGDDPYTKPNISAPGSNICSSVPTDGWSCGYSGTSMASPHTAGAVALLWSCNAALIGDMTATFELLQDTADVAPDGNCGAPADGEGNYTYGYGYLNVYQAGMLTCAGVETGTLNGHVYDTNGTPLEGATVTALTSATSDADGFYTMTVPAGTYSVTASKYGYETAQADGVTIVVGETTTQDFSLEFLGSWMDGPAACFDWTRYDAEFFPATGLIYALGGRSDTATNGSIYSYNPETGVCLDTGTDMPTPISNYTVDLVNDGSKDVLCTFGGRNSAGGVTLDVQCYDPLANTASVVTTLPAAYTGFTPGANAVYNNKVYVFGGFNSTSSPYELARTDRYDPVTHTFTQIGNLSQARSYLYAAVVDGKIYAFGGTVFDGTNLNAQTRAEVMADPEGAGTWDDAAVLDLPSAYDEGQAFGFDAGTEIDLVAGKVVLVGGGQWPGETADVWTYDTLTNTYDTSFPDLQGTRRNHAGVFVPLDSENPSDGLPGLWVLGGRSGADTPPYMGVEYFPLSYEPIVFEIYLPAVMK
ncbi:MAG: S8 family serine peptidase, partial [bacterium]